MAAERSSAEFFEEDLADMVYLAEKARAEEIKRSNKLAKLAAMRETAVDQDINAGDW